MTVKDTLKRRTTLVPVTTLEEVPVLSDAERKELIQSLKEAEQEIANGKGTELDIDELVAHMKSEYYKNKTA